MTTAEGFRALADWYEEHPEIVHPALYIHVHDSGEDAAKKLAIIAKAMGTCKKDASDYYFTVSREFGPLILNAMVSRDSVCKKIVTYECPESLLKSLGPQFEKEFAETV